MIGGFPLAVDSQSNAGAYGKGKNCSLFRNSRCDFDLVINIVLIPHWASAGAAIGTLVAEIIVWIVQYCVLRKDIKSAYLTIDYKTILWAILMAIVGVVWVKTLFINVFFKLIISAVIFFGIYFGVLMIRKDELTIEMKNQLVFLIGKKLNKN